MGPLFGMFAKQITKCASVASRCALEGTFQRSTVLD